MKKLSIDWRLLGGFSALLLLMVGIGVIGIMQIQSLSETVDNLGKRHLPVQKAILQMKINNGLYAMGIRNYVFWKSSRYLEAARAAADLGTVDKAADDFDRQLAIYSSQIQSSEAKQWIEKITASEKELRDLGSRIIGLADQGADPNSINKLIMTFESRLYRINDFIDETIQKSNLVAIKEQLLQAEEQRAQAILFLAGALLVGVLIGGQTAWLVYINRKREYQRRKDMVSQMIRTEERERQNLSAQVHDQMGQDLSATRIYLGLIEQAIPNPSQELKEQLSQSKRIISGLVEKMRNISLLLRPPALDEVGLVDSLEALLIDYSKLTGARYTYEKPEQELKLPPEHSLFLYRFTQEALTNAAKHAQARNVEIKLAKLSQAVELLYKDDGQGFDYRDFLKRPRRRAEDKLRLGLLGLQERAELLGGTMRIDTAPGKGTLIVVRLFV